MGTKKFFEDYKLNEYRVTNGRTITEADVVLHAGQTGDFYPHHMDEEWCKTQSFKQRIAHGTLVFSVGVGLTAGIVNDASMTYGYERLRFIKPVFINDTLRSVVTVKDRKDHKRPGYGIVSELVEVHNQRQELVMVCEHLLLVEKRNEDA